MITKYNKMFSGNSRIRWFKYTNISEMEAVSITRVLICVRTLTITMKSVSETGVHLNHLTQLSTQENFTPLPTHFTDTFRTTFNNDRINHADQPYIKKVATQFHAMTPCNTVAIQFQAVTPSNKDAIQFHAVIPCNKVAIQFQAVTPCNKVLCDYAVSWKTQQT
jgi:hypothetical protein